MSNPKSDLETRVDRLALYLENLTDWATRKGYGGGVAKHKPCPECGADECASYKAYDEWWIVCNSCEAYCQCDDYFATEELAWAAHDGEGGRDEKPVCKECGGVWYDSDHIRMIYELRERAEKAEKELAAEKERADRMDYENSELCGQLSEAEDREKESDEQNISLRKSLAAKRDEVAILNEHIDGLCDDCVVRRERDEARTRVKELESEFAVQLIKTTGLQTSRTLLEKSLAAEREKNARLREAMPDPEWLEKLTSWVPQLSDNEQWLISSAGNIRAALSKTGCNGSPSPEQIKTKLKKNEAEAVGNNMAFNKNNISGPHHEIPGCDIYFSCPDRPKGKPRMMICPKARDGEFGKGDMAGCVHSEKHEHRKGCDDIITHDCQACVPAEE